jgi:hypothetical protein
MANHKSEFDNFDATMHKLIQVPHSEIKAKLDTEKAAKKRKKKSNDHRNENHNRAERHNDSGI